jgi:signal transduction histidine kinase
VGIGENRVLEYLLVNAFHATIEGYILITCEDISQYDDAATVRLSIRDTGCGIPRDFYGSGQIFEPFAKVDKFSVSRHFRKGKGRVMARLTGTMLDSLVLG